MKIPYKILAVDDCKEFINLLEIILNSMGHDVYACSSASEAIEYCLCNNPIVVFLDMRIPGISSIKISEDIIRSCEVKPFIFGLTGFHPDDVKNEINGSDIKMCVQKPMELDELITVLKECIDLAADKLKKTN